MSRSAWSPEEDTIRDTLRENITHAQHLAVARENKIK